VSQTSHTPQGTPRRACRARSYPAEPQSMPPSSVGRQSPAARSLPPVRIFWFIRDFRDAFDRIQTRRPAEPVRRLQANVALCCSCADRRSSEPPKDAWTPPKGISGGLNAAWESAQVSQSSSRNSQKNLFFGGTCFFPPRVFRGTRMSRTTALARPFPPSGDRA